MHKILSSLSLKLLIGFTFIFFLAACSGNPTPIETQSQVEPPTQPTPNTPTAALPNETNPPEPTEADIGYPDPESQVGYPYPAPGEDGSPQENQDPESFPPTPGYPSPDNEVNEPAPVLKTELEATDPSTINLASGEIQLVEFFAFW